MKTLFSLFQLACVGIVQNKKLREKVIPIDENFKENYSGF